MNKIKLVQLSLIVGLCASLLVYFIDIYPPFIKSLSAQLSPLILLIIYVGLLASYFAFFLWPRMPLIAYICVACLHIAFFNFFLLSTKSSFAALGIIPIALVLFGILFVKRRRN